MEMNEKTIQAALNAAGFEGVVLSVPSGASEEDIDQLLDDAIHAAGMCECQEDNIPRVKKLRNEKNSKLRNSLSEKAVIMRGDLDHMGTIYNGLLDTIRLLDKDPDPDDKEVCRIHDAQVTVQMLKMLTTALKPRDRT